MSKSHPTLDQMGIQNPSQISSYNVFQTRSDVDILRIRYVRPKTSFLPVTRRYRFVRSAKPTLTDSGTRSVDTFYEISPLLVKAMTELDTIVKKHLSNVEIKERLLTDIRRMEDDMQGELEAMRQLVNKIE